MLPSAPPTGLPHPQNPAQGPPVLPSSTGPHQVLWGPMHPEEAHQQGGRQQLPHKEDEAKHQVAFVPQVALTRSACGRHVPICSHTNGAHRQDPA